MDPLRIGVVGCGDISGIYFENLQKFSMTEVVACSDLDGGKATARADQFGVPRVLSTDALLADPEVELVLNLTVPKAHGPVNLAAVRAGKHVYVEKPLALSREEAKTIRASNVLVGGAPDTFLGAGLQTCRRLIDSGAIGEPIGVNAFMMCHGHESWHRSPEFYYEVGGGPLFDMGPYYLTALVSLLGPIASVSGAARVTLPTRTITSEPKRGKVIEVETPTHIVGTLGFANGAIGQITTSFDVWSHTMPHIEIYGTEGSISTPDPNGFGGPVRVKAAKDDAWREVTVEGPYSQNSRGLGVLDMAHAIRRGREARASGALAYHVLDVMQAILESAESGSRISIASSVSRPSPIPVDAPEDDLPG